MIAIANRQRHVPIDRRRMRRAVQAVLRDVGMPGADVSVAVVDDRTIAALHEKYLDEQTPTDVLSFVFERTPLWLEGEVVASAETAAANARQYGNSPQDELLLYVIHGVLHLVGYDDKTPRSRAIMRKRERDYLEKAK